MVEIIILIECERVGANARSTPRSREGRLRCSPPTATLVVSLFSPVSTSQKRTAEYRAHGHSPNYSRVMAPGKQSENHFANSEKYC